MNSYWVTATSGSTGHPGVILFDREEWVAVLASFGADEWAGVSMVPTHRMKMASVAALTSGSPWHVSAQLAASATSWWMRVWMPTLSFDAAQPLAEITLADEYLAAAPADRLSLHDAHAGRRTTGRALAHSAPHDHLRFGSAHR